MPCWWCSVLRTQTQAVGLTPSEASFKQGPPLLTHFTPPHSISPSVLLCVSASANHHARFLAVASACHYASPAFLTAKGGTQLRKSFPRHRIACLPHAAVRRATAAL
ncbi:hypothetical protein BU16DRAFT_524459 [Lophium mytilinum]|uniref:Uncharacterized protein n=1 Tax=Lophium mytilinum TaxID=390894 RepID=A0A6A6R0S9_9PEZI|nr:hypothetical protein BU16DRAFT_524459 [Lophium mytilinum]